MGFDGYVDEVGRALMLRNRMKVDQLDYRRSLSKLNSFGVSQRRIARDLNISQPSLSSALKTAEKVPALRPGFSGADPYEICLRYSVGDLTQEQVVDELVRWDYVTPGLDEGSCGSLRFDVSGSFSGVRDACFDGLIEVELYNVVLERLVCESWG